MRFGPRPCRLRVLVAAFLWLSAAGAGALAAGSGPRVVVSIQPLHSLVSAVMAGVGEPTLLIRGANSPHDYSLTPADARALSHAQLVVWVGETPEAVLEKPIEALAQHAAILVAMDAEGVEILKGREGGVWESLTSAQAKADHGPGHAHGGLDGHIWLDPRNAAAIAGAAADALAKLDPANADRYRANAAALGDQLRDLEHELNQTLAPVRTAPFVVFHDAYQYFERRFGVNAVGSIALGPERTPGARRIGEIRKRLRDTGALCVFAEPQFEPALARTVVEGSKAKVAVLDPLGAELMPGPAAYFELLRRLARSLRDCLIAAS